MKKKFKDLTYDEKELRKETILHTLLIVIFTILAVAIVGSIIAIEAYVWTHYANLPVTEIPTWALWFMFGGNK